MDVTDSGFDVPEGVSVPGVEVLLTNRGTELSGTVRGSDNQPADDYTVLVYARDPARRRGLTRYFATARPDAPFALTDGEARSLDLRLIK